MRHRGEGQSPLRCYAQVARPNAATVLADAGLGLDTVGMVRVWIAGALTLPSLAAHLRAWFLHMTSYDSTAKDGGKDGPDR